MDILLKNFMFLCICYREVPLSWGISNIQVDNDIIRFSVNGCKSIGMVAVVAKNSCLTINICGIHKRDFTNAKAAFEWIDACVECSDCL